MPSPFDAVRDVVDQLVAGAAGRPRCPRPRARRRRSRDRVALDEVVVRRDADVRRRSVTPIETPPPPFSVEQVVEDGVVARALERDAGAARARGSRCPRRGCRASARSRRPALPLAAIALSWIDVSLRRVGQPDAAGRWRWIVLLRSVLPMTSDWKVGGGSAAAAAERGSGSAAACRARSRPPGCCSTVSPSTMLRVGADVERRRRSRSRRRCRS